MEERRETSETASSTSDVGSGLEAGLDFRMATDGSSGVRLASKSDGDWIEERLESTERDCRNEVEVSTDSLLKSRA